MSETDPTPRDDADASIDHVDLLLFDVAAATYALELGRTRQTMEVPPTSRVPNAPAVVDGVASVVGDVVVVVDARTALGAPPRPEDGDRTMVLLDHGGPETVEGVGLVVDRAADVATVEVDRLAPADGTTPPHGDAGWFRAVVAADGDARPTYVLDVDAVVDAIRT